MQESKNYFLTYLIYFVAKPFQNAYNYVYLYILLVFLRPQEFIGYLKDISLLPVVLVLGILMWLLNEKEKNLRSPQNVILPVFFLVMMSTIVISGWAGGAVVIFNKFFPVLALFTLISSTVQSEKRLRQIMLLIVVMSVLMVIHGMQQKQLGIGWTGAKPVDGGRITYTGIFNDPNDLGILFVISLPMIVYLYTYFKLNIIRIIFMLAFLTVLYGIYLTNSRGSMLAVFSMLGYFGWKKYGVTRSAILLATLLPIALIVPTRLSEIDASEESAHGRVDAWYEGIQMLRENPIFGVGTGQFTEHNYLTAHNSFILVMAEQGLFGFFLWFSFFGLTFVMLLNINNKLNELIDNGGLGERINLEENKKIVTTLLSSYIGLMVTISLLSRSYTILIYIMVGLIIGYYNGFIKRYGDIIDVKIKFDIWHWFMLSIFGIIAFYILVKILLAFS